MPSVQYGETMIVYEIEEKENLQSHYITVEKGKGVVLKGKPVSEAQSQRFILQKARWIIDKLQVVEAIAEDDIVTGSRRQYLGRNYYIEVYLDSEASKISIDFTESKFKVRTPAKLNNQTELKAAFTQFFDAKAIEKIAPRVRKWTRITGWQYNELKFRKLEKRWGSCTPANNIIINTEAIQLPFSLIDYLIVHELAHTQVKNHSKEFWAKVALHLPNWKALNEQIAAVKVL